MNEDDRIEALDRLARRRPPARDLWPGIAARLAPRRRYAWVPLALAASMVAGLVAVFTLTLSRHPPAPGVDVAMQAVDLPLTDDSRAIVKANLSLVRQAERQLRRALEEAPDSPTLRALLASAENRQRALRALL